MAGGLRLNGWLALCAAGAALSVAAWFVPAAWIDWQPELAVAEPWRAASAAFVHWSGWHLTANLTGCAVVAALGAAARLPAAAAWAWLAAWPLTHFGLLLRPELAHYGGLSGVLHAGVAVAAIWVVVRGSGRHRVVGAAIAVGLVVKLLLEEPWGASLRNGTGLDIAVAPLAHATGALAGLLCAALALLVLRDSPARRSSDSPGTA